MNIRYYVTAFFLIASMTMQAGELVWYSGGHVAYAVQKRYGTVVQKALQMFESDMRAVTGKSARRKDNARIEVYQLDMANNKEMKAIDKYRVPYANFIVKPDAFWLGVRDRKIIIVGSNGRGTAYGILELSRLAGVSPWIYWGDARPERKHRLTLDDRYETTQSPSVEFRGVFVNDEDWSTRVWDKRKIDPHSRTGLLGPNYYHKLCELLLRLRGNALWPAMHEGTTAFFKVRGNKEVVDSFDIYVGSSHSDPILRNNVGEWNTEKRGPYNFMSNRHQVLSYWRERARETSGMDALYTIGMRGTRDDAMEGARTLEEKRKVLQAVIDAQRKLLAEEVNRDLVKVPQVFMPYNDVLEIYENGLSVPDDVCLMWCDDNYGYMTRLSNQYQQKRSGWSGVYYHLSYCGRPHDYLWLATTQPGLLYHQMRRAYDHNARRLWIANIHDPKVSAYQLSLFMDMAWNIDCVRANTVQKHLENWLVQQFGKSVGQELVRPMTDFYRLCAIRKPEFMGWSQVEVDHNTYKDGCTPVRNSDFNAEEFGNELERYLAEYAEVKRRVAHAETMLRPELKDAFFAAVKYPVYCAAAMATKHLQAQEARLIGRPSSFHGDREALESAVRSWKAHEEIVRLTDYYNKTMAGGKWDGLMSRSPRGLPVFQEPMLPDNLTSDEIRKYGDASPARSNLATDGCVVRNACDYSACTVGTQTVDMLGHSMKAVSVPKNGKISFKFYAKTGPAKLYMALIPTQPSDSGDLRYAVSVDGAAPMVFSLKENYGSEGWKQNVLRGQAIKAQDIYLTEGQHTLEVTALDDHIVVDQWMIDYDSDRHFYMFPVRAAM